MKKLISFLMIMLITVTAVGCGKKVVKNKEVKNNPEVSTTEPKNISISLDSPAAKYMQSIKMDESPILDDMETVQQCVALDYADAKSLPTSGDSLKSSGVNSAFLNAIKQLYTDRNKKDLSDIKDLDIKKVDTSKLETKMKTGQDLKFISLDNAYLVTKKGTKLYMKVVYPNGYKDGNKIRYFKEDDPMLIKQNSTLGMTESYPIYND